MSDDAKNAADAAPRIPPLDVTEPTRDVLDALTHMVEVNRALDSRQQSKLADVMASGEPEATLAEALADLPEIIRTMLHHPRLFARLTDIGLMLLSDGALSLRDRELAILRTGWLCQAPYLWGEHVIVAKKHGFTTDDIERIIVGSDAPGWDEHEQAILRAAEELRNDAVISDATWRTLAKRLDERQLIELPTVIGIYQSNAFYQNSLRLSLHEGNAGLDAR